jgi:hypothetical protein
MINAMNCAAERAEIGNFQAFVCVVPPPWANPAGMVIIAGKWPPYKEVVARQ